MYDFHNMNNVQRKKILSDINYRNKYKHDFRIIINSIFQKHYIYNNNATLYNILPGLHLELTLFSITGNVGINYYLLNVYKIGFYNYKLLDISALVGTKSLISNNNNILKKLFNNKYFVLEYYIGICRTKLYDPYSRQFDKKILSPCAQFVLLLDYTNLQIGLYVNCKLIKQIQYLYFGHIFPGIIIKF